MQGDGIAVGRRNEDRRTERFVLLLEVVLFLKKVRLFCLVDWRLHQYRLGNNCDLWELYRDWMVVNQEFRQGKMQETLEPYLLVMVLMYAERGHQQ